jgi:uncharacterized membrane protein (UPF0127 family)
MAGSPMWLLRDGTVLASAELARSVPARVRGLLGRDGLDGALVIPARSVHTVGMRFPIDVAFLSKDLEVLDVIHMPPWRVAWPRLHSRLVLEAEGGAFERWQLHAGDRLELRGGE